MKVGGTGGTDGFNPRAPRGARRLRSSTLVSISRFQSTRPARGATPTRPSKQRSNCTFQSTRPARGATCAVLFNGGGGGVSIHAPRAGRDCGATFRRRPHRCFNPRAPRGARLPAWELYRRRAVFQSTRPARGATCRRSLPRLLPMFQSTRPARGATPDSPRRLPRSPVSIHAPRAGRDRLPLRRMFLLIGFNPRAPRGARHGSRRVERTAGHVSIHAPRAGRDASILCRGCLNMCFNPRAPRGARPPAHNLRGRARRVSIHAPRAGRDMPAPPLQRTGPRFNPRAPRGARLWMR